MDGSGFDYGGGKGFSPYLKCTYGKGPFDTYFIGFTTTERRIEETPFFGIQGGKRIITPNGFRNHMFVKKESVITLENNKGLVILFDIYESDEKRSLVGIFDFEDMRVSKRDVPSSEIVWI